MKVARRLFILLCLFGAALGDAGATADGPDAWKVTGVGPGDTLNVRAGPSVDYPVLSRIAHDTRHIQLGICVPTTTREQWFELDESIQAQLIAMPAWCVIEIDGRQRGWVNRRYLTEDSL